MKVVDLIKYERESYFNTLITFKHLGGRCCGTNHDMTKKAVIDTSLWIIPLVRWISSDDSYMLQTTAAIHLICQSFTGNNAQNATEESNS